MSVRGFDTVSGVEQYDYEYLDNKPEIPTKKSDIGLGNVDNTSDLDKPISNATQTALDEKVPNSRKVNGKALSADVTLTSGDIGYNTSTTYNTGTVGEKLSELNRQISEISESNNLINFDDVIIGKNWILQNDSKRAILNISVKPDTTYYYDFLVISPFHGVSLILKTNASSTGAIQSLAVTGTKGELTTTSTTGIICVQFANFTNDIVETDFDNLDVYIGLTEATLTAKDIVARADSKPWSGKRLVWLGTSIPAAGKYNISNPNSYPIMCGNIIGATVYNEAVGSSALHCKDPNRISTANPYGFLANFEAVSRCITNSLDEMEWIIEHYNDSAVFTQNVPSSLTDADKEFIRSCSWEIKLGKYFTAEAFPDAWIIDHGHNDIPSATSEATYTDKTDMSGTQHDGYYTGGRFISSTASSYLEFDVTDELYVWISGTFGSWYDIYDIFDADGNSIGYRQNASESEVTDVKVNVANAKTLRVSNPKNNLISTISVKRLTYPTYNSLYSYNGAFDFIVNKILTYNPRARIIMIGEYENQKYPTISENQLIASERWEFPIYKQWENLGWSQQLILTDGTYKTMLNIIIPDNLHPHTDTTGFALKTMAENISAWLNTIR